MTNASLPYDLIKRILRTEKAQASSEKANTYVFEVATFATKSELKKGIERIYKVKVQEVRVVNLPRKPKFLRRSPGYTSESKKAYVRLVAGSKIDTSV